MTGSAEKGEDRIGQTIGRLRLQAHCQRHTSRPAVQIEVVAPILWTIRLGNEDQAGRLSYECGGILSTSTLRTSIFDSYDGRRSSFVMFVAAR